MFEYESIYTLELIVSEYYLPTLFMGIGTGLVIFFACWGIVKIVSFFKVLIK